MIAANNYTDLSLSKNSRADKYWEERGFLPYFEKIRPNLRFPKNLENNTLEKILKKFNIRNVGFGNWVTIEDKYNYLNALVLALYDLNKVLKFNYNLGLGLLQITIGARGKGRALAHFEPGKHIINLTRYKDGKEDKAKRFLSTGGLGSFAHEYGHFLDYFAGQFLEKNNQYIALSGGISTIKTRLKYHKNYILRELMNDLLSKILWRQEGKQESNYYIRLLRTTMGNDSGYYFFRTEIFARAFEVYVDQKLRKSGVKNLLLTKKKYENNKYLTIQEFGKIEKFFDKIIKIIREEIS